MCIEWTAILKENEQITIEGFVNKDEINDDECMQYYDHNGFENGYNFPNNPYPKNRQYDWYMDWEKLSMELKTDNILQCLRKFANEYKTIDRGEYILVIIGSQEIKGVDKMDYKNASFKEVREQDVEYLRNVIKKIADKIEYDEYFGGWSIGETPLRDYIYEEENTILNPKELEGFMEEIIEDELNIPKGDDTMINKIADIIRKYKNVELITVPEDSEEMEFELYDFLDKPGNFESDIECILFEIQPVVPVTYTISHKYNGGEYWDGEEMVESNLSCTITVKYIGDNQ